MSWKLIIFFHYVLLCKHVINDKNTFFFNIYFFILKGLFYPNEGINAYFIDYTSDVFKASNFGTGLSKIHVCLITD